MSTRLHRRVVGKATNYTIQIPQDSPGTVFTNKGAGGPITFTLPRANAGTLGYWYRFLGVLAQTITVQPNAVGGLMILADNAANSMTTQGAAGAQLEVVCVEPTPGVYTWACTSLAGTSTSTT